MQVVSATQKTETGGSLVTSLTMAWATEQDIFQKKIETVH